MQMVEEVSEATAWVSATCKEYRGSNKKICLIGHSAGAQLCLMALLSLVNSAKQSTEKRQRLPAKVIGAKIGRSCNSLSILKKARNCFERVSRRCSDDEPLATRQDMMTSRL